MKGKIMKKALFISVFVNLSLLGMFFIPQVVGEEKPRLTWAGESDDKNIMVYWDSQSKVDCYVVKTNIRGYASTHEKNSTGIWCYKH